MLTGRCHCGAIRYTMPAEAIHNTVCHCADCRRHAGAPMVTWATVPADSVTIEGTPIEYASSANGRRRFCGACGTGLFYINELALPGMIDVQTGTLDDPEAAPPTAQIQLAERLSWVETAHALPGFDRFPG